MRLALQPFVEQARADARWRGHAQVTAAHLLRALLASTPGTLRCAQLGLCRVRLESRLDALCAALPPPHYRASATPELAPELGAPLEAVRARGFLRRFFAAPAPADFFDALLDEPQLERASLRFDPTRVEALHADAHAYAARRAHRNVLVDHAMIVLLEKDERLRAAVRLLGLEPNTVRNKLAYRIGRRFRSFKLQDLPGLVFAASLHANSARQQELTTNGLVNSLFQYEAIRRGLIAAKADPFDLYFAWAHGVREEAIAVPDGAALDIVIEDDAFSRFEAVVAFLRDVVGIVHDRAVRHAAEASESGSSIVAAGIDRAEAELLLLTVREARRERFLPLRVTARSV